LVLGTVILGGALSCKDFPTFENSSASLALPASVPALEATVNQAIVPFDVKASGSVGPYNYTLTGVPGLVIQPNGPQITGTPTAEGTSTGTVTVTDRNGNSKTTTFSATVNKRPTAAVAGSITPCTLLIACSFTPVTAQFGTLPLTYSATGLPPGLSISPTTGVVSGSATAIVPNASVVVTVTDKTGATTTAQFTFAVRPPLVVTPTSPDPVCTSGVLCTFNPVTVTGSTSAVTYAISPALTPPLALDVNTGVITGTPNAVLPQTTYRITVTDASNFSVSADFKLTVNGAVTATSVTPSVASTINIAFGTALAFPAGLRPVTGTGGTGTLTYSLTGANPTLPAGLQFSQTTGAITGSPTAASTLRTYTVKVEDTKGSQATANFAMVINPAVSATPNGVSANKGCTKDFACGFTPVNAAGGTAPLVYTLSPAIGGLSISSTTGAVSGTPNTQQAATTYKVIATDAVGAKDSANFSLTVNPTLVVAVAVATRTCQTDVACSYIPITVSGGTPTVNASVAPTLPPGLNATFAAGQVTVSGTPSASSIATTYTVTAVDGAGAQATAQFQLTVSGPLVATLALPTVASTLNVPFATAFPAVAGSVRPVIGSGGTGTLTYSINTPLPAGLQFSSTTGAITGTPTAALPTANFTVTVTDQLNVTASRTFSLTINPALTASSSPRECTVGAACNFSLATPSGGTIPYVITLRSTPTLPSGLNVVGENVTGTPGAAQAVTTYTVDVRDASNDTTSTTFTLTVNAALVLNVELPEIACGDSIASPGTSGHGCVRIRPSVADSALAAGPFQPVKRVSGGTLPISFSITTPTTLPAGMTFSGGSTGQVTALPTLGITSQVFTVRVRDAQTAFATGSFTLSVLTTALSGTPQPACTEPTVCSWNKPVAPSGGRGLLTYDIFKSDGTAAPAGFAIDANGVVTTDNTVTAAGGPYNLRVTVTDSVGRTAFTNFTFVVVSPP
jgi:hypothetical protein